MAVYPEERLPFDETGIPGAVSSALQEAITCFANGCYRAAAMLARRSLEELCHDQNISGPNLKVRLDTLGANLRLPPSVLDTLHDLRLLGNDAAHIESQEYKEVGKAETELAIAAITTVLQLAYQHPILANKLKSRKR